MNLSEWTTVDKRIAYKKNKCLSFSGEDGVREKGEYARKKSIAGVYADSLDMDVTVDKDFPHATELFRAFLGDSE